MSCPCGKETEAIEQVRGEGLLDGAGGASRITRRVLRALYWSDPDFGGTDTEFCSAACMLRWHERFFAPFLVHTGRRAA